MKRVIRLFFVLALAQLMVSHGFAQSPGWPKTLLWKLSGKGLQKPSYLFGTMHLQDKRIFNLGDSFYHHFERAEGFAIEVDFREYLDSMLAKGFQLAEDRSLADEEEEGVKDEIKESRIIVDSAVTQDLEQPPPPREEMRPVPKMPRSLRKEFRKMRNEQIKSLLQYGRMPTILDAYLYGMAMKQGKWLGAVEEVEDQLSARDELGKDIDVEEEIKKPEKLLLTSLGNMIKVYLAQDLSQIEEIALNQQTARTKTVIFNNRNIKMARSIDSLSRLRSMFYAVGAAHLPGDSGIIKLLRRNGYMVTPVISTSKMAAEKYAAGLPSLSWYEVGQADGLYKVDMPGIPSEYSIFGELVKMKVFVDVTTMNFYMAGHTIAQFADEDLEMALKDMGRSMHGKVTSIKRVNRDDVKGVEGFVNSNGADFRIQVLKKENTAFFLMLGGSPGNRINPADADKFFYSFKAGKTSKETGDSFAGWKELSLPEKAVTVQLPVVPKHNKAFERKAEGTGWNFSVFDCTDQAAGIYYIFQVRDINAGLFLDGDSVYFAQFRDNLLKDKTITLKNETGQYAGHPMLRFDAESEEEAIFYKTMNVIRGNRVYTLMALGHVSRKEDAGPEHFFNSMKLTEYKQAGWDTRQADDRTFSSRVPEPFTRMKPDEEDDSSRVHYTSYDPYECVSYEVIKDALPEFYWVTSDTALYRERARLARSYDDSLLSYSTVRNGNITGVEQLLQSPDSRMIKRMRYLLHGDTLYTLMSFIALPLVSDPKHSAFFEQFSIQHDQIKPTVLNNKANELLSALAGKDSARFEKAKNVLDEVPFTKGDLPYLHQALLARYPDDTLLYGSAMNKLIEAMNGLSDSSTVDFIRAHYDELSERGSDQLGLLNVLVNLQTSYSYIALKDLFVAKPPRNPGTRTSIGYRVMDSLALTRILFPEMIALVKNKDYWEDAMNYTSRLIDSALISKDLLKPYEAEISHIADTLLNGNLLKEEDAWTWSYKSLVKLLGNLNTDGSNAMLKRFLAGPDLFLKQTALLALLQNNLEADKKEIEKIAASNDYRLDLYDELKKTGRENLFPAKYHTQRYFAEARIYMFDEEDYSPSSVEFIGEREVMFDGEKRRFFLFRLVYDGEEGEEQIAHLGISGPYSLDEKDLETTQDGTLINYEEEYNKKTLEKQFGALLEKGEEYLEKQKKQAIKN